MLSVEFRSVSWFDGVHARESIAFQREIDVVHTIVDEPQVFSNGVPAVWETTHDDHALVRMHGRNTAALNDLRNMTSSFLNLKKMRR